MTAPCRTCGGPREGTYQRNGKTYPRCRPCHTKASQRFYASGKAKYYPRTEYGKRYRKQNAEELRANGKIYRATPAAKRSRKNRRLIGDYGIDIQKFEGMLMSQNGACFICAVEITSTSAHVDHDHKSGKVRALLCGNCNRALGCMQDNPRLCRSAATYLEVFA